MWRNVQIYNETRVGLENFSKGISRIECLTYLHIRDLLLASGAKATAVFPGHSDPAQSCEDNNT
jgi:hypothetical protein